MKKIGRMNEIAWIIGIVGCALGVSLCTKANFGLSMIAAPPYIFHVAFRVRMPWLTQGTAEYIWQGILLLFMCIVTGRFHWKYLLSFGTAVISGLCIDFWLLLLGGNGGRPAHVRAGLAGNATNLGRSSSICFSEDYRPSITFS